MQTTTRLMILALAITAAAYAPGLAGPFLFDDPPNILIPISAWLDGRTGWQEIVLGNRSGMFGRPLSMLTFLANAAISDLEVVPFKATNLAIHLACGSLIFILLASLLERDPQLSGRARAVALLVCALWLLHPLQVSTVLYVVQRMAQLSTLFTLIGLIAFVYGRKSLEVGKRRRSALLLWVGVPVMTTAAILSKENGALLPLLCAVIELIYFRPSDRSFVRQVNVWFLTFLIIPGLTAAGWLLTRWTRLLETYNGRLFSMSERLISQPRVIMDYLSTLMIPRGPSMGIYTDDFVASTSLVDPPTTFLALVAIIVLIAIAWRVRTATPAITAGIGIFLAGHAMESSIFPLELHFEHRNYLPSLGVFLALTAGAVWCARTALARSKSPERFKRVLLVVLIAGFLVLTFGTVARVHVWTSWPLMASQGAAQHPQSMRAQLDYAQVLQLAGETDLARDVFEQMLAMRSPQARHVGAIDLVTLDCMAQASAAPRNLQRMKGIVGNKIQLGEMLAFENLTNYLINHRCRGLPARQLADLIVDIVDNSGQPAHLAQIWRSRFNAARLYTDAGDLSHAMQQAALAWMSGAADTSVGVYLASIYLAADDLTSAKLIVADARQRLKSWDHRNQKLLGALEAELESRDTVMTQ